MLQLIPIAANLSKTEIHMPKAFLIAREPTTIHEALQQENWKTAMTDEYLALLRNRTWSFVCSPPNKKAIECKWILKIKEMAQSTGKNDLWQRVSIKFQLLTSQSYNHNQIILTRALSKGWQVRQLDINNAFLNGDLKDEVFMEQPPGLVSEAPTAVCKLHKALYGLIQAAKAWFDILSQCFSIFWFYLCQI